MRKVSVFFIRKTQKLLLKSILSWSQDTDMEILREIELEKERMTCIVESIKNTQSLNSHGIDRPRPNSNVSSMTDPDVS